MVLLVAGLQGVDIYGTSLCISNLGSLGNKRKRRHSICCTSITFRSLGHKFLSFVVYSILKLFFILFFLLGLLFDISIADLNFTLGSFSLGGFFLDMVLVQAFA